MAGVRLEHVSREYIMGKTVIKAVDDISFTIPEGKYTIILGASGAGKSTVLNILGGMDSPPAARSLSTRKRSPGSTRSSSPSTAGRASALCSSSTT